MVLQLIFANLESGEVTCTFFLVENPKLVVEAASAVVIINAAFNVA